MSEDLVSVRMYRGILGDCFLLTLRLEGSQRFILIDCGVLQNIQSGPIIKKKLPPEVVAKVGEATLDAIEAGDERIERVVADIAGYAKHIDLLVITHEHYDHLSGFQALLDTGVTIGELWMAWTEDPTDSQAQALQDAFGKGRKALAVVTKLTQSPGMSSDDHLLTTAALSAFLGLAPAPGAGGRKLRSTREMIDAVKAKVASDKIRYLAPGQVLETDQALGLKAYVLGPPRDKKYMEKSDPSAGDAKEVYLTSVDEAAVVEAMATARLGLVHPKGPAASSSFTEKPFAKPHLRGDARPPKPGPRARIITLYDNPEERYRSIDQDWTGSAEALALKMDSDTNNTSLALAFELPDGRVLLFPGDAQVGNWLSWRSQTYPPLPVEGQPPPKSIDDILANVVFYKVGHHGSHNATLSELGLEKMINPRLVAAIPVVEAVAAIQGKGRNKPGMGWAMPYSDLFSHLESRTRGRIVRGDGDIAAEIQAFAQKDGDPDKSFRVSHHPDGLWVELTCAF